MVSTPRAGVTLVALLVGAGSIDTRRTTNSLLVGKTPNKLAPTPPYFKIAALLSHRLRTPNVRRKSEVVRPGEKFSSEYIVFCSFTLMFLFELRLWSEAKPPSAVL